MVDAAEPQQQIASIPFIDAAIEDEDLFGSALSIAIHLFPDWKSLDPEKLVTSRCTEGITNKRTSLCFAIDLAVSSQLALITQWLRFTIPLRIK